MTVADWDVDLDSPDGRLLVDLINSDGVAVFRAQPGFVRYRLMLAGPRRTVAVAEWRTEEESLSGSANYRQWMADAGVRAHISMETETGPIIVAGDADQEGLRTPRSVT
jgi:hypothetical protein